MNCPSRGSTKIIAQPRLCTPSPICRWFEFTLYKALEWRNTFISASHTLWREPITKLAFPPWHAVGWFNTMTTGKRRQAANSEFLLKKMTAASPDQRALSDVPNVRQNGDRKRSRLPTSRQLYFLEKKQIRNKHHALRVQIIPQGCLF